MSEWDSLTFASLLLAGRGLRRVHARQREPGVSRSCHIYETPLDPTDLSYIDHLLDEFADLLDGESEFCDDQGEEIDEICYYLYGPDQDRDAELYLELLHAASIGDPVWSQARVRQAGRITREALCV